MKRSVPRQFALLVSILGAAACEQKTTLPAPAVPSRVTTVSIQQTRNAIEHANSTHLEQAAGVVVAKRLGDVEASISDRLDVEGFTYLRVRVAGATGEDLLRGDLIPVRCEPKVECLGVWDASNREGDPDAAARDVLLRFARGSSPTLPVPVAVVMTSRGGLRGQHSTLVAGEERRVLLRGATEVKRDSAPLRRDFQLSVAAFLERFGPAEPYVAFAANRIRAHWDSKSQMIQRVERQRGMVDTHQLMDFYTGRSEIQRSLQTDRALGVESHKFKPTVELKTVAHVETANRDYAALAASDSNLPHPRVSLLSKNLPRDTLSIEFASVRDLVQLPRLLDERFDEISRALEGQPGTYRLVERYREQLIVEPTRLSEQVGQVAVGAAALVVGDPYLREGTDISLILEVRQLNLLETVLAKYVTDARATFPQLETKEVTIEGTKVILNSTADGRIRRYHATVGSRLFLSNSPARLAQLLRIEQGKESPLARAEDYLWSRRESPFDAGRERAYLFFGEDFVKSVTGPRSKILESRRVRAQSELRAVEYAALLHATMEGEAAKSQAELLRSGWLLSKDLTHFDGTKITYSSETGAVSAWGTAIEMIPLVDLPLGKVDRFEAKAYESFRAAYEREWSGAIDPTSIRVLRGERETDLRTELRILPLSPNGEVGRNFREIVRNVGLAAASPGEPTDGVSVLLALSPNAPLRELAQSTLSGNVRRKDLSLGFLGDWVKLGLSDDPILFSMGLAEKAVVETDATTVRDASAGQAVPRDEARKSEFGVEQNLHRLPVWAMVHIKNPILLTAALAALRSALKEDLDDWVAWKTDEKYRGISITRVDVHPSGASDVQVSIYYAMVKDALLIALQRSVLESRVDDVFAGRTPHKAELGNRPEQLYLEWSKKPGAFLSALLIGALERSALSAHDAACTGLSLLALGVGEERANAADGRLAMRYLGYEPRSPNGAGLRIKEGECLHPVYGSFAEPVLPKARDSAVSLHRAIEQLRKLRFGLGTVPRGVEQELVGTMEITAD